jgi:cytochrome P450
VLASAMRSQMAWHIRAEELNPFKRYNPMRYWKYWSNSQQMDRYISTELDKVYEEWKTSNNAVQKSKSVINLVIDGYMNGRKIEARLDPQFKKWAITQIREFLFVGHDSTAATIVYCLYLLSKNKSALANIRAEHDKVFGSDVSNVTNTIKEQPQLINQLPYTAAVIKETLRLFPPASGLREGLPGVSFCDSRGNQYPTEGLTIWILHPSIHRNPRYWPQADSFVPERWLVEADDPLYPPRGGWRPFEFGPRNCIGQTLVMLDVKIALAMLIREFDINDAYEEFDMKNATSGIKTINGERAYQVSQGAAHPADGFPCRVSSRQTG